MFTQKASFLRNHQNARNTEEFVKMTFLSEHMIKSDRSFRDDPNHKPKFDSMSLK